MQWQWQSCLSTGPRRWHHISAGLSWRFLQEGSTWFSMRIVLQSIVMQGQQCSPTKAPPHPPHVSSATLARCIMGQSQGSVRFVSATAASTLRYAGLHQSCWKPSKSLLWTLLRSLCVFRKLLKSHMVQTSLAS
jgi:hypothetical protein